MEKEERPLWLILAGLAVFSIWWVVTRRSENGLWLLLSAICVAILAYRLYGAFLATRALSMSNEEAGETPGERHAGQWVIFAYQFASIAGVGVIVGPALAAQFGYLPGFLWTLAAAVVGGAVHDMVALVMSARRKGAFLPSAIAAELGPWAGLAAWAIMLIAILLFLAVTGSLLADLLVGNLWVIYSLAVTVIVALLVSSYELWLRPGRSGEAVALGVVLSAAAIIVGVRLSTQPVTSGLLANRGFLLLVMGAYCCVSALLPAHLLGRARGAISGVIGLGVLFGLMAGLAFGAPFLRQPAISQYASGGGPILSGGALPYILLIITNGALSGFSALPGTAVSARLLKREGRALPVGFGAFLMQSLLVIVLLIAVCALYRWDYYAISTNVALGDVERIAGAPQRDWDNLRNALQTKTMRLPGGPAAASEESVRGGGAATTIAVAAANLLRDFPGMPKQSLPSLYRFMYVFQALLLAAAVEGAVRAGRVAVDEAVLAGQKAPPLAGLSGRPRLAAGAVSIGTALFSLLWVLVAVRTDVTRVLNFYAFVAFLLAAVTLGVAAFALRSAGSKAVAAVAIACLLATVVALVAGAVTVRDSVRLINRRDAIAQTFAQFPQWGPQLGFMNADRAREGVRQWKPMDLAMLYIEKGQADVIRQMQNRLGYSETEGRKIAQTINSRAIGLSLWSWLQIILTVGLVLLAGVVAIGRSIRIPLRWPGRGAPAPLAEAPLTSADAPTKPVDFEI